MNTPMMTQPGADAGSTPTITTLSIPSMTCGSCIQRVKKALLAVDGVVDVAARRDLRQVTVQYNTQRAGEDALRTALVEAGYPAEA